MIDDVREAGRYRERSLGMVLMPVLVGQRAGDVGILHGKLICVQNLVNRHVTVWRAGSVQGRLEGA